MNRYILFLLSLKWGVVGLQVRYGSAPDAYPTEIDNKQEVSMKKAGLSSLHLVTLLMAVSLIIAILGPIGCSGAGDSSGGPGGKFNWVTSKGTVDGFVYDVQATKAPDARSIPEGYGPVAGILVTSESTTATATTDASGYFRLGDVRLDASANINFYKNGSRVLTVPVNSISPGVTYRVTTDGTDVVCLTSPTSASPSPSPSVSPSVSPSPTLSPTSGVAKIVFDSQPGDTTVGASIAPAVLVRLLDAKGNLVTTATDLVTISLQNNPSGATLSGTLAVKAVGGVATFNDLKLNKAGSGYTLRASLASGLSVTSNAFNVQ